MDQTSPNLTLPYLQAAQAQKHVTHNEALERLDLIVQLTVQSFAETTPPLTPLEGQIWAVGQGAVNDWTGQEGMLAAWANGGWLFVTPRVGWQAVSGTEQRIWDGADWVSPDLPELQNLAGVGVNTTYDGTNRLAVSAEATLLTHDGAGHQLKLNKATAGDTASLLFQTGWSGRAEMGTTGSDDFAFKVSPDGSLWHTAIAIDAATGVATVAALGLGTPLGASQGGTGVANDPAATLTRSGAHPLGLTTTAATAVTLPTTGTLATLAGAETLSGKTLTAPVINTSVTGTAVTQTATDTTAGRLTKVGDFGIGGIGINPAATYDGLGAVSQMLADGATSTPSDKPTSGRAHAGLHLAASSTRWVQLLSEVAGGSDLNRLWWRRNYNGTVSAWRQIYGQGSILGTVSQAAGVPTGAIIERGSNANGAYVRFADGTQICTRDYSMGARNTLGTGTLADPYRTNQADIAFAAAFIAAPVVVASAGCDDSTAANRRMSIGYRRSEVTQVVQLQAVAITSESGSGTVVASILAVGRWF